MLGVDTNILLYAQDTSCPEHPSAVRFLREHASNSDFVIAELVLVELYVLLRNPKLLRHPLSSEEAVSVVQGYRRNRYWQIIEHTDGVMNDVWRLAEQAEFARRRVFDARIAFTLSRRGVREFATRNTRDFADLGFDHVWDPIATT